MSKLARWLPKSQAITASLYKALEQENEELAQELSHMTYSLAELTVRYKKLCQLTNTPPESIQADEVEIVEILEYHNPLNYDK